MTMSIQQLEKLAAESKFCFYGSNGSWKAGSNIV